MNTKKVERQKSSRKTEDQIKKLIEEKIKEMENLEFRLKRFVHCQVPDFFNIEKILLECEKIKNHWNILKMMTTDPKQKTTNCLSKFFNFVGIVSEQAEILADFCGKHSPSQFMIPRSLQKEGIRKFLDILKVRFFKNQIFKKRLESYQQLLPSKNGENADQNANSENILATKVVGESEKKLIENDKFIENCADKNAEIISGPIQQNTNACEIKGSSVISNTDGLVDGLVEDGVDGSVDDEVDETVENGIDKLVECEVDEKIEKLVQNQKYIKQDSFVVGKVKKFTVNIVDGVIKVDPVCLSGESSNPSRSSEIKKTIRENTWKPETGTVLPKCRSGLSLQKKITNATVSPTNEQTSSSTITEQDIEVTVKGHLEEFDMKEWLTIFKIEALLETESQILFKYTPGSFVEEARNFALSRKTPLEIIFPEQFVVQDNNDGELPTIQQKFWHEIDCRKDHDVYEILIDIAVESFMRHKLQKEKNLLTITAENDRKLKKNKDDDSENDEKNTQEKYFPNFDPKLFEIWESGSTKFKLFSDFKKSPTTLDESQNSNLANTWEISAFHAQLKDLKQKIDKFDPTKCEQIIIDKNQENLPPFLDNIYERSCDPAYFFKPVITIEKPKLKDFDPTAPEFQPKNLHPKILDPATLAGQPLIVPSFPNRQEQFLLIDPSPVGQLFQYPIYPRFSSVNVPYQSFRKNFSPANSFPFWNTCPNQPVSTNFPCPSNCNNRSIVKSKKKPEKC